MPEPPSKLPRVKTEVDDSESKRNGHVESKDWQKLFEVFGLDFTVSGDEAHAAECPFCQGQKFSVNRTTGQYQCLSLNRCAEKGNAYTFINRMYDERLEATCDTDLWALRDKRKLSVQTLRRHGIVWDSTQKCYWLPFKIVNDAGDITVRNIQRYWLATNTKLMLPSLPQQIYGLDRLSSDKNLIVILCEGPWDAIDLDQYLTKSKTRARYDIVAVPSANIFNPKWFTFLDGHTVRLCLDNDKAGRDGQQRIIRLAREHKANVKLLALKWPIGCAEKCDLGDLVQSGTSVMKFLEENCHKADLAERRIIFVRGDQVAEEKVDWLWPGHIAFSTFTSLSGLMGTHKSGIARYIAAKATAGEPMPNCEDGLPPF